MSEVVPVLSATKVRRSLGETKKRESVKKKPLRTTVVALPKDSQWPDVDEEVSCEVRAEVKKAFLRNPRRKCPLAEIRKVPKEERRQFRKDWIAKGGGNLSFLDKRRQVVIGVNAVSRAMDEDGVPCPLLGLIVERNVEPEIVTKLLIPIARAKGVPVLALQGLRETFKEACQVKCVALGFTAACDSDTSDFKTLLNLVQTHAPSKETQEDTYKSHVLRRGNVLV